MDTLLKNRVCNSEQFEDFIHGFNLANPLFSIVDVGNGKEAADTKIKGAIRYGCIFFLSANKVNPFRVSPSIHQIPTNG